MKIKEIKIKKRKVKNMSKKIGLPPGTLIFTGERKVEEEKITVIDYNEIEIESRESKQLEKNLSEIGKNKIRWINIDGLGQIENIEELGKELNLHPLVLEDVVNPQQRPKIEGYEEYIFIVLRCLHWSKELKNIISEQISIVLGKRLVITFRESSSPIFLPILERLNKSRGKIRKMGADYLVYSLIDIIIDNYFEIIEGLGRRLDKLEELLISNPQIETLQSIRKLKREVNALRRSIWPSRNVINGLQREESLVDDATQIYLRDVYDHIIQIVDTFENYRDTISGMLDMYLSSVSNKMNEIMKVLTIISTIFIPISFLAGFYGMNFVYMPELSSPIAYPLLIMVMSLIGITMILFFKRKKWL